MSQIDLESYPFFAFDSLQGIPVPPVPQSLQTLVHDDSLDNADDKSNGSEEDDNLNDSNSELRKSGGKANSNSAAAKKVRAACSNCRASHVACSHEIPCRRCVEHGIADTCKYLPRKKRTNFKKRKTQDKGGDDVEEITTTTTTTTTFPDNSRNAAALPTSTIPSLSAFETHNVSSSLPSLFGLETGLRHGAQDPSLLPFTQLLGNDFPTSLSLLGASNSITPTSINSSIQLLENILSEGASSPSTVPTMEENSWLSQVITDSDPLSQLTSSSSSPLTVSPPSSPADHLSKSTWALSNIMSTSTATAPASPSPSGSRALQLLQEMKAKNERLERLLSIALNDIKELKKQQLVSEQATKQLQLFKLHNLQASTDFNQRGMPAIAMFSLSGVRHGEILQCNEAFRHLVGYNWEDLMKSGFTCCKLFPERFKLKLGKDYQAIMAGEVSSGQDDLAILRGDSREVPVRAFYHIIFNDMGVPLYKMFYAFPL